MSLAPEAARVCAPSRPGPELFVLFLLLILATVLPAGAVEPSGDASAVEPTGDGPGEDDPASANAETLDEPLLRTGEILIESTRMATSVLDTPGNVTLLTREQIQKSGARDLPDLLRREAGIYVTNTTTNREGYTVEARGFNNGGGNGGRTLVMVDGRRVNEEDSGQVDWAFLPMDNVQQIEIVRGPVSAAHGDNAIAGVIHIRTVHPEKDGVRGTLQSRLGTYDSFQSSALAEGRHGPASISAFFDYDSTDAYRDRANYRGKAAEMDVRLRLGEEGEYGTIGVKGGYGSTKRLRPGDLTAEQVEENRRQAEPGTDDNFDVARQRYIQGRIELTPAENVRIEVLPYHRRRTDGSAITDPFSDFVADTETDALGLKTQMEIGFEVAGLSNRLLVGGDVLQEDVDAESVFTIFDAVFGDTAFPSSSSSRRKLWGAFVQNELWLTETLLLSLGVRRDEATYKATDRATGMRFEVAHSEWAPRGALTWNLCEGASVYASYARGFRFPNQNEAFGFFGFQPGLVPETSDSYEVGAKIRRDKVTLNFSIYQMNVRDEIMFNPEALNPFFLPFEVRGVNQNIDRVRHRGIEFFASVRPVAWLEIYGGYTYDDVRIRRDTLTMLDGNRMPITPEHRGHAGVRLYLPYGFEASVNGRFVGSRYLANDLANALPKMSNFASYDARIAWNHELNEYVRFEIEGIGYNLTSREYNEFGARGTFGPTVGFFPSPERHYLVGARVVVQR